VLTPAPVLSLLVGIFWAAAYVLVRGTAGGRLPLVVLAAALGAWAGDAVGARLGIDPLRVGDYHLVAATLGAWLGIAVVSLVAILGPARRSAP
jgi:uncharacterized membrane protein YeaQ/YmgE (transglycosylase-associated protein family)